MCNWKAGATYRNKYTMEPIDFWLSKVEGNKYYGYWVFRHTGKILNEEVDILNGVRNADWEEVVDA